MYKHLFLGIIGFTRRKDAVAQWNLIKHEKSQFTKYLRELNCLSDSDETSLHHAFSQSITEGDEKCVEKITAYVEERQNSFDISKVDKVMYIATGKEIEKDTVAHLLHFTVKGEEAYQEDKSSRLEKKNKGLFYPIQKTFKKKR